MSGPKAAGRPLAWAAYSLQVAMWHKNIPFCTSTLVYARPDSESHWKTPVPPSHALVSQNSCPDSA